MALPLPARVSVSAGLPRRTAVFVFCAPPIRRFPDQPTSKQLRERGMCSYFSLNHVIKLRQPSVWPGRVGVASAPALILVATAIAAPETASWGTLLFLSAFPWCLRDFLCAPLILGWVPREEFWLYWRPETIIGDPNQDCDLPSEHFLPPWPRFHSPTLVSNVVESSFLACKAAQER